jgi:hypothetical protein
MDATIESIAPPPMVTMGGSRPASEYVALPNLSATDDAHPDLQAHRTITFGSGMLQPWTPSCRCGGDGETLVWGVDQDGSSFGSRHGQVAEEALTARVGACGYIVARVRVGSGRTSWFHLVQPGSNRLAHLSLC